MVRAVALAGQLWGERAARKAGVPVNGAGYLGDARYIFCLGQSERVPDDVLSGAKQLGVEWINFHCSDLRVSYGRGGHPIENLLLRGHDETVISAHQMTSEIDAGPVYGVRGPVSLAGTKDDILARFIEPCADLMRWILETQPEPQPQVGEVVRFRRLTTEAYRTFWAERERCLTSS